MVTPYRVKISKSPPGVSQWNKRYSTYFEVLFAFANANLHNNGVLVFAHAADLDVSISIHNWAHTEEFYVVEDWFGMNILDLQSPTNSSELVILLVRDIDRHGSPSNGLRLVRLKTLSHMYWKIVSGGRYLLEDRVLVILSYMSLCI